MAGLLTYPSFKLPSHPSADEQWYLGAKTIIRQETDRALQQRELFRILT